MKYYWENAIELESVVRCLKQSLFELHECEPENHNIIESMIKSYPSFVDQPYRLFCNGSCYGFVKPEVINEAIDSGLLIQSGLRITLA